MTQAKSLLVGSTTHKLFHDIQTPVVRRRVVRAAERPKAKTAICLSPYKSGTTFFGQIFPDRKVAHEPLHAPTLRMIDDDAYLDERWDYLGLDLECSGFLSLRAGELMARKPDHQFIMLARPPMKWAHSVFDYFSTASFQDLRYNYISAFFFERIGCHDIADYRNFSEAQVTAAYEALLSFWLKTYQSGIDAPNCLVLPLDELEMRADEITQHLGFAPTFQEGTWKRKNRNRTARPQDMEVPSRTASDALYAALKPASMPKLVAV